MNAQDLKNSILQLATQGKLVEQREEEGTAKELIIKLLESKKELLKENKIYKKKPTDPFYNSEELPFDIPESWRWVQLSNVSIIQEGAGIRKYQYRDSGIQLFSVTNILEGSIDLEKKQLYVSTEEFRDKYTHLQLNKGDIVIACSGGSWGKVAIYDNEATVMLNTSTLRLRFFEDIGNNDFLYYIVQSAFFKRQLQEQLVGIQPNFGYAHYSRICLPLPPLEEQKRIVAKIEELMPYVEKYDKAYSEVERLNKKFPEDMQKSILQYAIQGKLVEQREEDGTAEELYKRIQEEKKKLVKEGKIKKTKALPEITEDEIPFNIPDNWKWVRFSEVIDVRDGTHDTPAYVPKGYPLITGKDFYSGYFELSKTQYVSEKDYIEISKRSNVSVGDILFSMIGGNIGSMILIEPENYFEMAIKNVALFKQYTQNMIMSKYLMYYLKSQVSKIKGNASGGAQAFVSLTILRSYILPLPPLEEQKRIVEKLKELLPYTKQLNK